MKRHNILFLVMILALSACNIDQADANLISIQPTVIDIVESETATAFPKEPAPADTATATSLPPTITAEPKTSSSVAQVSPTAVSTEPPEPTGVDLPSEAAVAAELAALVPPERDDERLAIAFRGLAETDLLQPPLAAESLPVGLQQTFKIPNVVDNTVSEIEAELVAVSDNAYFWFDKGTGFFSPEPEEIDRVTQKFDEIYLLVRNQFGAERNPGIDGDPRLHIVHASPIALCGVTEETLDQCYLAGLVNSTDLLPQAVDPRSNEREMFVMNARRFGSDYYLGVLAHEFRHMIEDNYDKSDVDWEIEGSATLAAQLAGLPSGGIERGNMFLEQPDQQLNTWADDGTAPYYGQGYLFNRFIYDQLGSDLYRQFVTSPLPGFQALDAVNENAGLNRDGQSLWLDFLVALAIHDDDQVPSYIQFENEGLATASTTIVNDLPATFQEEVSQFAADYYELPGDTQGIDFSGATDVSLLDVEPVSGERFWFAQRANYSNPRLTFSLDLSNLEQASLSYNIYTDIELGYDFAYVSLSQDGGTTWTPLVGDNMQGLAAQDNPAGSALSERFYTGRNRQWQNEKIDLSPHVGQEILLRFEYVTDPILTYGGLAIDNISVPELNFFDGAEEDSENGFAEGFVRATSRIPQTWHIQHVSFGEDGPQIRLLPVDVNGDLSATFENSSQQPSILIVAASAPTTLEKANYELIVYD